MKSLINILTTLLLINRLFASGISLQEKGYLLLPPDSISPPDSFVKGSIPISNDAITSLINYKAKDSLDIDFANKIISLYGQSEVTYQTMKLTASVIHINWETNLIHAEGITDSAGKETGSPVFVDGSQQYLAKKMDYNFKTKKGKLYELVTKEGENYIIGEEVKRDSQDVICVKDAKYTTCDHPDPHFYIASTKIKILKDKIISGPAWMVMEGIPLPVAVPFGFFPKKQERSSGILFPSYGQSGNKGYFLKGMGYYFGINDYVDLELKGDVFSRGSWLVSAGSNYSKRYRYAGRVDLSFAYNKLGDKEAGDFSLSKDFNIHWTHVQDVKAHPNTSFSADVNAGSANSFRNNSLNTRDILNNTLSSSVSYGKRFPRTPVSFTSSLRHTQNLNTHSLSLSLPDFNLNISRITPFKAKKTAIKKRWYNDLSFRYNLNFRNSLDTYDTLLFRQDTWKTWKNGFKYDIPFSTSLIVLKYFNFSPSLNYTGRIYFSRIEKSWNVDSNRVMDIIQSGFYLLNDYNFNATLSTRLYGTFNLNSLGIKAIRHQITPRFSLIYRPDFSNPRFRYYDDVQRDSNGNILKYSYYQGNIFGFPGSGEQGLLSFSVDNNIEAKLKNKKDTSAIKEYKKIKLVDFFGFSGAYNFLADSFNMSNIAFSGRTTLFKNRFNIQFSGSLDPYAINSTGQRLSIYQFEQDKSLFRLTHAALTMGAGLNPKSSGKKEKSSAYSNYVDFDIPWTFSFNYSINYSKPAITRTISQVVSFRSNITLTRNWRLDLSSGYDITHKAFTISNIDIYRDLHCWEMSLSLNPFGTYRFYMFRVNVKSSTLKDLKFDKKKYFYDF